MVLDLLFGFSGRINRAKFFLAMLIQAAFLILVVFVVAIITAVTGADHTTGQVLIENTSVVAVLVVAVSQLAIMVKRAHDCGKSGLYLLLLLLPLVCLLPMFELPFFRGSVGPNRYGPDPLAHRDIRRYSEAIERNPKNARAFVARGGTRALVGDYDKAMADLDAAIALDPRDAEAFNSRAFIHFRLGRFASAIAEYDRAIALNPRNAEALFGRGAARLRMNDQDGNQDIAAARAVDPGIARQMVLIAVSA